MTFTTDGDGGNYKHQHQYGLLYGEYYGLHSNPLYLLDCDMDGNGNWNVSVSAGYTSTQNFHDSGKAATANRSANQYQNYSRTQIADTLSPYKTVCYWRRIN